MYNNDKTNNIIEEKRVLAYSINKIVKAVKTSVNNREYGVLSNPYNIYYIPVSIIPENSCISLDNIEIKNPFGNWNNAYVIVQYDARSFEFNYYFTFNDDAGYGMEATDIDDIVLNYENIIVNPIPENARPENITKQIVGNNTSIFIFQTSKDTKEDACNVFSAIKNDI